jgi:hypothetical protein
MFKRGVVMIGGSYGRGNGEGEINGGRCCRDANRWMSMKELDVWDGSAVTTEMSSK